MKLASLPAISLVALLGLAACQATTTTVSTTTATAPVAADGPVQASSFADLINAERARAGLAPLKTDPRLAAAARAHAEDMVRNDYFSHRSPSGARLIDRTARAGYCRTGIAENIAFGQRSEAQVFRSWLNSAGHRRNMLRRSATAYGLAESGNKWVLVLGDGC